MTFERYTDRARRAVILADQEAEALSHGEVGTGHLLLGLLAEGEAVAFQALDTLGVSLEAARQQVTELIGAGGEPPRGHIPFGDAARERLGRISDWHARETGPAGTVGDFCVECGKRWPCDTGQMADGLFGDDDDA